eukprot:scaffold22820_cov61-Phaeocystis_antarctica.AAC.7
MAPPHMRGACARRGGSRNLRRTATGKAALCGPGWRVRAQYGAKGKKESAAVSHKQKQIAEAEERAQLFGDPVKQSAQANPPRCSSASGFGSCWCTPRSTASTRAPGRRSSW